MSLLNEMWGQITVIEAQEQLKLLIALDWPNMKKTARQKKHKELYNQAYPSELRVKNYVSVADLQKVLGR